MKTTKSVRKKKQKKGISSLTDNLNKDIIYLTLIVLVFALFFITFIALDKAEERCDIKIKEITNYYYNDNLINNNIDLENINFTLQRGYKHDK